MSNSYEPTKAGNPLKKGWSRETISENIREMMSTGTGQKRAVAVSLDSARRSYRARNKTGPLPEHLREKDPKKNPVLGQVLGALLPLVLNPTDNPISEAFEAGDRVRLKIPIRLKNRSGVFEVSKGEIATVVGHFRKKKVVINWRGRVGVVDPGDLELVEERDEKEARVEREKATPKTERTSSPMGLTSLDILDTSAHGEFIWENGVPVEANIFSGKLQGPGDNSPTATIIDRGFEDKLVQLWVPTKKQKGEKPTKREVRKTGMAQAAQWAEQQVGRAVRALGDEEVVTKPKTRKRVESYEWRFVATYNSTESGKFKASSMEDARKKVWERIGIDLKLSKRPLRFDKGTREERVKRIIDFVHPLTVTNEATNEVWVWGVTARGDKRRWMSEEAYIRASRRSKAVSEARRKQKSRKDKKTGVLLPGSVLQLYPLVDKDGGAVPGNTGFANYVQIKGKNVLVADGSTVGRFWEARWDADNQRWVALTDGEQLQDGEVVETFPLTKRGSNKEIRSEIRRTKESQEKARQAELGRAKKVEGRPSGKPVLVDALEFKKAVDAVALFPAKEASSPVLTGIVFDTSWGDLSIAGTDGFALAQHEFKVSVSDDYRVVVGILKKPDSLAKWVKGWKASKIKGKKVAVDFVPVAKVEQGGVPRRSGVYVALEGEQGRVFEDIGGNYPKYRQLIPDPGFGEWKVRMDLGELKRAVDRVKRLAKQGRGIVRLNLIAEGLLVSVKNDDREEGDIVKGELIGVSGIAGRQDTAMNVWYLENVLRTFEKGARVALEVNRHDGPMRWDGGNISDIIVMPMFVQEMSRAEINNLTDKAR